MPKSLFCIFCHDLGGVTGPSPTQAHIQTKETLRFFPVLSSQQIQIGLQDSGGFNSVDGHSYCIYIPPIRSALLEKTFYLVHFSFLSRFFLGKEVSPSIESWDAQINIDKYLSDKSILNQNSSPGILFRVPHTSGHLQHTHQ